MSIQKLQLYFASRSKRHHFASSRAVCHQVRNARRKTNSFLLGAAAARDHYLTPPRAQHVRKCPFRAHFPSRCDARSGVIPPFRVGCGITSPTSKLRFGYIARFHISRSRLGVQCPRCEVANSLSDTEGLRGVMCLSLSRLFLGALGAHSRRPLRDPA